MPCPDCPGLRSFSRSSVAAPVGAIRATYEASAFISCAMASKLFSSVLTNILVEHYLYTHRKNKATRLHQVPNGLRLTTSANKLTIHVADKHGLSTNTAPRTIHVGSRPTLRALPFTLTATLPYTTILKNSYLILYKPCIQPGCNSGPS